MHTTVKIRLRDKRQGFQIYYFKHVFLVIMKMKWDKISFFYCKTNKIYIRIKKARTKSKKDTKPFDEQFPCPLQFKEHEFSRNTWVVFELFAVNSGFNSMIFFAILFRESVCASIQAASSPIYAQ